MKLIYLFLLLSIFQFHEGYSQKLNIQEIKLSNSILENEISNFIEIRKKEYSKFNASGYIVVSLNVYNSKAKNNELAYAYSIKDQYVSLKKGSGFPLFFTYINTKLVLLYFKEFQINDNIDISQRSKKKLIKNLEKFLGQSEHLVAYNAKDEKIIDDKHFYPNEVFNIHGGIELRIYADNSVEVNKR